MHGPGEPVRRYQGNGRAMRVQIKGCSVASANCHAQANDGGCGELRDSRGATNTAATEGKVDIPGKVQ